MATPGQRNQLSRHSKASDWPKLRARLKAVYSATGQVRQGAVLDNHQNRDEYILRKLGVVCDADVDRIARQLGLGKQS